MNDDPCHEGINVGGIESGKLSSWCGAAKEQATIESGVTRDDIT
jgi:hypothetical protein